MRRFGRLVIILLCLFLFLPSCGGAKPNRGEQWKLPFCATIEGNRGETAFAAEVTVRAESRSIHYTAPDSLAGLMVTETQDGIRMTRGTIDVLDQTAAGFLAPVDLLCADAELFEVTEQNGEVTLTYTDGTKILLGKDGNPRAVIGNDLFFTVLNFLPLF